MSTISNQIGVKLRTAVRPVSASGWTCRIRDWGGETVAMIPFSEITFTVEMNALGAGSCTFDLDSEFLEDETVYKHIFEEINVWEFWEDNYLRAAWVPDTIDDTLIADDLTRQCIVSGAGLLSVLQWYIVASPGASDTNPRGMSVGDVTLTNWPYRNGNSSLTFMEMWQAILASTQGRTDSPELQEIRDKRGFNGASDSAGREWALYGPPSPVNDDGSSDHESIGVTLYDKLVSLATQSGADFVYIPGRGPQGGRFESQLAFSDKNSAYGNQHDGQILDFDFGSHVEEKVTFFSTLTQQKGRQKDRTALFNAIWTGDAEGNAAPVQADSASITKWGRREKYLQYATQNGISQMESAAAAELKNSKDELSSWTLTVPPYTTTREGVVTCNQVFVDYTVGDWIGVGVPTPAPAEELDTVNTTVDAPLSLRVDAITGHVTPTEYTIELTLMTNQQLARQKRERMAQQGSSGGGSGLPGSDGDPGPGGSGGTSDPGGSGSSSQKNIQNILFQEDIFVVRRIPYKKKFKLRYLPMRHSEHVVVGQNNHVALKLRRSKQWSRKTNKVTIKKQGQSFTGSGPWWVSVQYAHLGEPTVVWSWDSDGCPGS